ncbi:hypothetical protein [Actinoplanes sp. TFC3]|uniref:hypothetical protein n=1 Tax=Actinoplanes sp. TFC3 TaxID=1710355 RepID=UPI00082B298D|nr:hypothetical protein [Actinoplanes sp. TFC3]
MVPLLTAISVPARRNAAAKISFRGDDIGEMANKSTHGPEPPYPGFGGDVLTIDANSTSLRNQAAIVVGSYDRVALDYGKAPHDKPR